LNLIILWIKIYFSFIHGQVSDVSGIKDAEKTDGEKMMNCEQSQERMIDVLYGEEVNPRQGFEFFQHLSECGKNEVDSGADRSGELHSEDEDR